MRRFFVEELNNDEKLVEIYGDQFLHMTKVLRMKEGDTFIGLCGDGFEYACKIISILEKCAVCEVLSKDLASTDAKTHVAVFQACVKGDKFDLIIQKLSELGISEIVPFDSDFSIAKCQANKVERYNKIATEACKQCRRTIPLNVKNPLTFNQVILELENYDLVLFCNEHESALTLSQSLEDFAGKKVALIIGSEGGFSPKEIQKLSKTKAKSITLGKRILRAETAAIATSACVMLILGELE